MSIVASYIMLYLNAELSHKREGYAPLKRSVGLLGNLSNQDGNAKENVALKMTSQKFKSLRDRFNYQVNSL